MGVEGWIILLMVVGMPGSIVLSVWAALQHKKDSMSIRPIWIVLLEGRQDEDDHRDDWGEGDGWSPPNPRVPSSGASGPVHRGECRQRRTRARAAIVKVER